jgi:RHS repeat-associated protein
VTLADGTNLLTAVVADALNRSGTNTALAWLPATASFTYDANGNLTGDGRRTFAYDDEDQLVSVTVTNGPNSSTRSTFVYDALGRRRVRTEYTWLNNAWVAQSVTRYVYDHMLVLQERDGDNAPTATYTRGLDLSGGFQGAGGIGGLLAFTQLSSINPRHTYYHADAGGNITALIDDHATLLARYAYDPYGNLLGLSGPMAEQNFYRFSSKEVHANSGLYYYGYRFYEPSLQRWMNRDPAGERGGINIYGFVRNAPVLGWDPDGMDPTFAPHIGMFQGLSRDQHVQAAKAGAPVALAIAAAGFAAWCGPAIYSWALANPAAAVAGGTAAAETGAAIATGYPGPMPSSCIGAAARRVGQAGGCSARCAAERADPFVARYGDRALVRASERPPYVSGPDPLAQDSPHTVLRWDGNGRLYGAKEFGNGGIHPTRDISFTQPTFPNGTPRPGHLPPPTQHPRIPNPSGGSPRRGPEQPLQFP